MDTEKEFETIREIVKSLLEIDEKCRNSDKWLTIEVLRKLGFKIYVDYKELDAMPSWETIRRTRQKLQEENQNLRADEKVQDLREERREVVKELMSSRTRGVEIPNKVNPRTHGVEVFSK